METIGEFEYSKKDLIGHGAFAVVFKGRHRLKKDLIVAIKCITKKNLAKSQNLLSKEIKILKELSDLKHENVVALLDCKETAHHVYLVMEYCDGGDLADYLQAKGTLSEDTIALFLRQIAGAMKALNGKGIVHRDIKPQNILLCNSAKSKLNPADTKLKIADFGFARFLQDGVMAATLCGSPMYMAPEVIMSLQYDAKADLWSVGTIVYQCLTGKAPFQAQTPQQLKHFYEKNVNLTPNIPSGTSPELRDLLYRMLRRNACNRIEFDDFFRHPFLQQKNLNKSSSPVPVPKSKSRCSLSESTSMKVVSASPLSGNHMSPHFPNLNPAIMRLKDNSNVLEDTQELDENTRIDKANNQNGNYEDFVLVPENIPSDQSAASSAGTRLSGSVDLNTIFGDDSPDLINMQHRPVRGLRKESSPPALPYDPSRVSPESRAAYKSKTSPIFIPHSSSPVSVQSNKDSRSFPGERSTKFGQKTAQQLNYQTGTSPPSVLFTIGTPPNLTRKRLNSDDNLALKQTDPSPPVSISNPTQKQAPFKTLPTIADSSTRITTGFNFLPKQEKNKKYLNEEEFGFPHKEKIKTCPDNIGAVGFSFDRNKIDNCIDRSSTDPVFSNQNQNLSRNKQIMSENFVQTAFSNVHKGLISQLSQSPVLQNIIPYSSSGIQILNDKCDNQRRQRKDSTGNFIFSPSPSNMEGPVSLVAPQLCEETLMNSEHNDTVAKLNFITSLVECIIELAESRSSPLCESVNRNQPVNSDPNKINTFHLEQLSFVSEEERRLEQLVLYARSLQLLNSSLELARDQVQQCKLQPSTNVKAIVKDLNAKYHQCLNICKQLQSKVILLNKLSETSVNADKLIYNYAIEMCQTAALDELFGNPEQCFRRYNCAQILFHSLAHQVQTETDRELIKKYRQSVERRLFNLFSKDTYES